MRTFNTLSTTASRVVYNGNSSTTVFSTQFVFFDSSSLVVTLVDSDASETVKTEITDYTVTGGDGAVGTVTTLFTPLTGQQLVIERVEPFTQTLDLTRFGTFPADNIEARLDRVVAQIQRVKDRADSSIQVPITTDPTYVPPSIAVPVAGKYLRANADGTLLEWADLVAGTSTASDVNPQDISITTKSPGTGSNFAREDHTHQLEPQVFLTALGIYNVKNYGAVGDAVTDDTSAIQDAIDAAELNTTGGVVYFPPGNYFVTATLTVQANDVKLRGAGPTTTALVRTGDYGNTITIQNSTANTAITWGEVSGISFVANSVPTSGAHIFAQAAHFWTFDNLRFVDGFIGMRMAQPIGIFFNNITMQFTAGNATGRIFCSIERAAAGYEVNSRLIGGALYFDHCDWDTVSPSTNPGCQYGIKVDGVDGLSMDNCRVGGTNTANFYLVNDATDADDITGNIKISNSHSDLCTGGGAVIADNGSAVVTAVQINNSRFDGSTTGTTGIDIGGTGGVDDITIAANLFTYWKDDAIKWTSGTRGTIVANVIRGFDEDSTGGGDGILLQGGTDVEVVGNTIDGESTGDTGIIIASTMGDRCSVKVNTVTACQNGISIENGADNFTVIANTLLGNSSNALADSSSTTSKTIHSNVITSENAITVGNQKILGARKTGWTVPTGTLARTDPDGSWSQTVSGTYTQAEVEAIEEQVKVLTQTLAALINDLHADGAGSPTHALLDNA